MEAVLSWAQMYDIHRPQATYLLVHVVTPECMSGPMAREVLDFVTFSHILAYNFQTVNILINMLYYLESSGKKH